MLEEIQVPFSNEQTWFVTYGRLADPIGAIGLGCAALPTGGATWLQVATITVSRDCHPTPKQRIHAPAVVVPAKRKRKKKKRHPTGTERNGTERNGVRKTQLYDYDRRRQLTSRLRRPALS